MRQIVVPLLLSLVKDERLYDRFDQAFASYFNRIDRWAGLFDDEEIRQELARQLVLDGEAADLELDLHDTIRSTARNGGILDIKEVPERHNAVKVLMLFDVGGSMDEHVEICAQLFSAAKSEFKYLEYYYFHNFIYEAVWQENERRFEDKVSTWYLLRKFGRNPVGPILSPFR